MNKTNVSRIERRHDVFFGVRWLDTAFRRAATFLLTVSSSLRNQNVISGTVERTLKESRKAAESCVKPQHSKRKTPFQNVRLAERGDPRLLGRTPSGYGSATVLVFVAWTCLLLGGRAAVADDDALPERKTFVPIEDLDSILSGDKEGVLLRRAEFAELFKAAQANAANAPRLPAPAVVSNAEYQTRIQGDHLLVDATIQFRQFVDGWQQLEFDVGDLSVEKATLDDEPARMTRRYRTGKGQSGFDLLVFHDRAGPATLKMQLSIALREVGNDRATRLQLPSAPSATLKVAVPAGQHLQLGSRLLDRPAENDQPATYSVPVGGQGGVVLLFSDHQDEQRTDSLTFATTAYGVNVAPGEVTWQAKTSLQVFGSTIDRLFCTVPSRLEITDVESTGLESWELADNPDDPESTLITLNYRQPFDGTRAIIFRGVMATAVGEPWAVPDLGIRNATSHVGRVVVQHPPAVRVRLVEAAGARASAGTAGSLMYDVWKEDFSLAFETRTKQRDLHSNVSGVLNLLPNDVTFNSRIDITPYIAPIFNITFRLPADWTVDRVTVNGENVAWQKGSREASWNEYDIPLATPLPEGQDASFAFFSHREIDGWPVEDNEVEIALPVVRLPEASLVVGSLAITAGLDVEPVVTDSLGLDPAAVGVQGERLGFEFQSSEYEGTLTVRRKPSRISAQTLTFTALDREVLTSRLGAILTIDGGGLRELNVGLSESAGDGLQFQLLGSDVRVIEQIPGEADENGIRPWNLKLDQRVVGDVHLRVTATTPRGDTTEFTTHQLTVPDAERINGYVAIEGAPDQQLKVTARNAAGGALREVDPVDVFDSKVKVRPVSSGRIVAAHQYTLPGYSVSLSETRFDRVAVPTAVCDHSSIQSILGRTGELQHRADFQFVAVGAQSLRVRLPAGETTELWATLIDGDPIEVRSTPDGYLVPLPAAGRPDAQRELRLFYRSQIPRLAQTGAIEQQPPLVTVLHSAGEEQRLELLDQNWSLTYPDGTLLTSSDGDFSPQGSLDSPSVLGALRKSITRLDRAQLTENGVAALVVLFVLGAIGDVLRRQGVSIVGLVGVTALAFVGMMLLGVLLPTGKYAGDADGELTESIAQTEESASMRSSGHGGTASAFGFNDNNDDADCKEIEFVPGGMNRPTDTMDMTVDEPTAANEAPALGPVDVNGLVADGAVPEAPPTEEAMEQSESLVEHDFRIDTSNIQLPGEKMVGSDLGAAAVPARQPPVVTDPFTTQAPGSLINEIEGVTEIRGQQMQLEVSRAIQEARQVGRTDPAGARVILQRANAALMAAADMDADLQGRFAQRIRGVIADLDGDDEVEFLKQQIGYARPQGLLSLSLKLDKPSGSQTSEFRYTGNRNATDGTGLRVNWQDREAGGYGRVFLMVVVALFLWIMMLSAPLRTRAVLAILGIAIPVSLISVAPTGIHPVLDGVFLGAVLSVVLWLVRAVLQFFQRPSAVERLKRMFRRRAVRRVASSIVIGAVCTVATGSLTAAEPADGITQAVDETSRVGRALLPVPSGLRRAGVPVLHVTSSAVGMTAAERRQHKASGVSPRSAAPIKNGKLRSSDSSAVNRFATTKQQPSPRRTVKGPRLRPLSPRSGLGSGRSARSGGEGWGEGAHQKTMRSQGVPLTLTLSPASARNQDSRIECGGEGTDARSSVAAPQLSGSRRADDDLGLAPEALCCRRSAAEAPEATADVPVSVSGFGTGALGTLHTAMLLSSLLIGAEPAQQQEPVQPGPDQTPVPAASSIRPGVVVPYDPSGNPLDAERVLLTREQFLELWNLAHPDQKVSQPHERTGVISDAFYDCRLKDGNDQAVSVQATFVLHSFQEHQIPLPIPLGPVALESATLDGEPAALEVDTGKGNNRLIALIDEPGLHTLDLKFDVPAQVNGSVGQFTLPVQGVPAGRAVFRLPETKLSVRVNGSSTAYRLIEDGEGELLQIPVDGDKPLTVGWRPPEQLGMVAAIVHVNSGTSVLIDDTGVTQFGRIDIRVPQGAIADLSFDVPDGLNIQRITGPHLAGWGFNDVDGERRLRAFFSPPVTEATQLSVQLFMEQSIDAKTAVTVPTISPREVTRETGTIALVAPDNLAVRGGDVSGLVQMNVTGNLPVPRVAIQPEARTNNQRNSKTPAYAPRLAWRYTTRPFQLNLDVERQQPESTAVVQHAVTVGGRKVVVDSFVRATLKGSPRTALTFELGEEFLVLTVQATSLADWYVSESDAVNPRTLTVEFTQPLIGDLDVVIKGQTDRIPGPYVGVELPRPLEVTGLTTWAGAWFDPAFEATAVDTEGWKSVGAERVPARLRDFVSRPLKFAYQATDDTASSLGFTLQRAIPELSASVLVMVSVTDTTLDYTLALKWTIEDAAVDQLSFTTPVAFEDRLNFNAKGIREVRSRRDGESLLWTIHLHNPLRGEYFAHAVVTEPPAQDRVTTPPVRFRHPRFDEFGDAMDFEPVENQRQYVLLVNRSQMQMVGEHGDEVESVPAGSIPIYVPPDTLAQAAELLRVRDIDSLPSWSVRRLQQTSGAPASVNVADLTLVVAADGSWRCQALYTIRNRRRQFLAVRLPDESRLLSLIVRGQPMRPVTTSINGDSVQLIPLPRTSDAQGSFPVKLVCIGSFGRRLPNSFVAPTRNLTLPAPRVVTTAESDEFGIPVARTLWTVHLPESVDWSVVDDPSRTNVTATNEAESKTAYASSFLKDAMKSVNVLLGEGFSSAQKRQAAFNVKQHGLALRNYSEMPVNTPEAAQLAEQIKEMRQQIAAAGSTIRRYSGEATVDGTATVEQLFDNNDEAAQRGLVNRDQLGLILGNAGIARQTEDLNGNGVLDVGEDFNGNGVLDFVTADDFDVSNDMDGQPDSVELQLNGPDDAFTNNFQVEIQAGKGVAVEGSGKSATKVVKPSFARKSLSRMERQEQSRSQANYKGLNDFFEGEGGGNPAPQNSSGAVSGNFGRPVPLLNKIPGQSGGGGFGGGMGGGGGGMFNGNVAPGFEMNEEYRDAIISGPMPMGERQQIDAILRQQQQKAGFGGVEHDDRELFMQLADQPDMTVYYDQQLGEAMEDASGADARFAGSDVHWTRVGGLSLNVNIPTPGTKLQFSKVGGQPKLTLQVQSRELISKGIGLIWTAVWIGIAVFLINAFRSVTCAADIWRPAGWILLAGGLVCFLTLPAGWSGAGFVAFVTGWLIIITQFVRRRPV